MSLASERMPSFIPYGVTLSAYVVTNEETGEKINWKLGDNNRIVITKEDYSDRLKVDFGVPWIWHLAEVISLVAVVGYIVICRKRQ